MGNYFKYNLKYKLYNIVAQSGEDFGKFLWFARSHRYHDSRYSSSCTPTQLCNVLKKIFKILQMSHEIPFSGQGRKMYEKALKKPKSSNTTNNSFKFNFSQVIKRVLDDYQFGEIHVFLSLLFCAIFEIRKQNFPLKRAISDVFYRCLPIAFTPHQQVCSRYWTWNYFLTQL